MCQASAEASHTLESRVGGACDVLHAVQGLVQTICGWHDQYPLVCIDPRYPS